MPDGRRVTCSWRQRHALAVSFRQVVLRCGQKAILKTGPRPEEDLQARPAEWAACTWVAAYLRDSAEALPQNEGLWIPLVPKATC